METAYYEIGVPGHFDGYFLDVETKKVPTPDGFTMPNGEPLRQRWSAIMVGFARNGGITLYDRQDEDEVEFLLGLDAELPRARVRPITYAATRDFDEMVLKGRFTNARRAHLPEPTWPHLPGDAGERAWHNLGSIPKFKRDDDCQPREVPDLYAKGFWMTVAVHLLRDVCELILAAGRPDRVCETWCRAVLFDYELAVRQFSE